MLEAPAPALALPPGAAPGVASGAATGAATGDEALLEQVRAELDAVEAALARLDSGSYGSCEVCEAPIGHDRQVADPLLTRCRRHIPA